MPEACQQPWGQEEPAPTAGQSSRGASAAAMVRKDVVVARVRMKRMMIDEFVVCKKKRLKVLLLLSKS
jgi:hypothetical protein